MSKAGEIAQMLATFPGLAPAVDELFASFQEQAGTTDLVPQPPQIPEQTEQIPEQMPVEQMPPLAGEMPL
jgi:hypothetical protein